MAVFGSALRLAAMLAAVRRSIFSTSFVNHRAPPILTNTTPVDLLDATVTGALGISAFMASSNDMVASVGGFIVFVGICRPHKPRG